METLFTSLTHALEGSFALAIFASALWGVLSILLSPCHLSSIPLVIGFISGQGKMTTARALGISSLFALGILLTIACLGVITALAGRMLGDVGAMGNYLVAGVFFAVGLHLLGVISVPWFSPGERQPARRGYWAAFVLGLVFGVAVGPCTFAYMAPMLGVAFTTAASRPLYSSALLLAYGLGHCSVIVLAGTSIGWVENYLKWESQGRCVKILKTLSGVLVILAGLYLTFTA